MSEKFLTWLINSVYFHHDDRTLLPRCIYAAPHMHRSPSDTHTHTCKHLFCFWSVSVAMATDDCKLWRLKLIHTLNWSISLLLDQSKFWSLCIFLLQLAGVAFIAAGFWAWSEKVKKTHKLRKYENLNVFIFFFHSYFMWNCFCWWVNQWQVWNITNPLSTCTWNF